MSFDWQGYLQVAKVLADERDEAFLRSAINRAYYAAYSTARHHRGARSAVITRDGSHQAVWKALRRSGVPEWRKAGGKGFLLLEMRLQADYDDVIPSLRWMMTGALGDAAEILRLLSISPAANV